MDEKDQRSTVRRADDVPRPVTIDTQPSRPATTLWRMRSAIYDNQASCSVTENGAGCDVTVVFTRGLGVPEHFDDLGEAIRHSMEIFGRLTALGWIEIDLKDTLPSR